jgi:hypothetical protein
VNTPLRRTTSREKRILWVAVALLAAACVAGAIVAFGSSSEPTPAGCIRVELPSTMGASASTLCGDRATSFCRSPAAHSAPLNATALPKCRDAGFSVAPS